MVSFKFDISSARLNESRSKSSRINPNVHNTRLGVEDELLKVWQNLSFVTAHSFTNQMGRHITTVVKVSVFARSDLKTVFIRARKGSLRFSVFSL